MPSNRLVGLGGYKESGKDTFAEGLPSDKWVILGMSQPLLQATLILDPYLPDLGMTSREAYEYMNRDYTRLKAESPEFRRLLIALGTDVGREILGKNIWVDIATRSIREAWANGMDAAITGIRFPNELQMVRDLGGELVWVKRPGLDAPAISHASETSVSEADFDRTVLNDSTVEELHEKAIRY